MQGHLRAKQLDAIVHTECHCCGRDIEVEVGSDLRTRVLTEGASPFISVPRINFGKITEPSILDVF